MEFFKNAVNAYKSGNLNAGKLLLSTFFNYKELKSKYFKGDHADAFEIISFVRIIRENRDYCY